MTADAINASLEVVAGLVIWLSVIKAWRTREIVGVHWLPAAFFGAWALWNCFYYPMLGQWFSAYAALLPLLANLVWLRLYWRFAR